MKYLLILVIIVFYSCSNQTEQKQEVNDEQKNTLANDTLIGAKNITNEIAGSAYRKRATSYFLIVKNDTSDFRPIFSESKEKNEVAINLNLSYTKHTKTFSRVIKELRLILNEAAKEYNLNSLRGMFIGRLILTGDMAISITEEFNAKFEGVNQIPTSDYNKVSSFLLESSLAKDVNKLFVPFSIVVNRVSIEKAYFTDKEELLHYSKVTRDTARIPDQILDFMTWLNFKSETIEEL